MKVMKFENLSARWRTVMPTASVARVSHKVSSSVRMQNRTQDKQGREIIMRTVQALLTMLVIAFTIGSTASYAATTTIALYRFGETDSPAAVNGGNGDNPTADTWGGPGLSRVGTLATYTNDVGPANSSFSMNVAGGYYHRGSPVTTSLTDVGFEMWVKPTVFGGFVFMNGNGYGSNGEYLYVDANGKWHFTSPGSEVTNATAVLNQWVNLALVRDDVGAVHGYVNGVAGTTIAFGVGHAAAAGTDLTIGAGYNNNNGAGGTYFNGLMDEFRVFTFANFASFNPLTDLNLTIPEPSAMVLMGMGGWLMWLRTTRRK